MGACTFCGIIDGDRDAHVIYQDERTIAFLDAQPATDGHTLVAPTTHQESILGTDESISGPIIRTVEAIALAMREVLDPDGFSLFHTTGNLVGDVSHAHVHLLPRYESDAVHLALSRSSLDEPKAKRLTDQLALELELHEPSAVDGSSGADYS